MHTPTHWFHTDLLNLPSISLEELEEMIAEEDKVAVRWTMHGTHRGAYLGVEPTGRRIRLQAFVVLTFRDGKVVGRRGIVDQFGLLKQLDAV